MRQRSLPYPKPRRIVPLELRQYLDILKRHKWFIIEATVVVAFAAGMLSSLRAPVYRATARVLLTPNDPTQQLNPTNGSGLVGTDPDRYVAGQVTIAESEAVATEAVKALRDVPVAEVERKVSVHQGGKSNVLSISASDPDPSLARDMADAVAKGYIENRRLAAVSGLQGAAKDIEARLGPLQATIAELDGQIGQASTLPGATSQLVSPVPPGSVAAPSPPAPQIQPPAGAGGVSTTQEAIKAARYAAAVQYETLYSRQQQLVVDISLKRGDAELIGEAKTPDSPISPRPKRDGALGLFVGLLSGVGIVLLREQLDDRVRSAPEVERLTGSPLLAQLPFDDEASKGRAGIALIERPNSPLSESIRSLRTSIEYLGVDKPLKVILVTSPAPGEGKSLVATNLAAAFAQADYRTVLIAADLRRSTIHEVFEGLDTSPGVAGLLCQPGQPISHNGHPRANTSGDYCAVLATALVRSPQPNLLVLPPGPAPLNPAELLGSRRLAAMLDAYSAQADIVVIDTPPLLPVTDAAVLAHRADGVVLVTAVNETRRDAVQRAKKILEGSGGRMLGIVVNKTPRSPRENYYAYYGPSSKESEASSRRGWDEGMETLPARTGRLHRLPRRTGRAQDSRRVGTVASSGEETRHVDVENDR